MVEVTRRATPIGAIRQVVHPVAMTRKKDLLRTLLQSTDMGQTLVFTRTKARANQLTRSLEGSDRRVAVIHGNKSQSARARALGAFRSGQIDTLIATDIAARGIDVDDISHVINFDLPHVPEDYVHRIGRTARAGKSGDAISLAAPEERAQLAAIERLVGNPIRRESVVGFATPADTAPGRSVRRHRSTRSPIDRTAIAEVGPLDRNLDAPGPPEIELRTLRCLVAGTAMRFLEVGVGELELGFPQDRRVNPSAREKQCIGHFAQRQTRRKGRYRHDRRAA